MLIYNEERGFITRYNSSIKFSNELGSTLSPYLPKPSSGKDTVEVKVANVESAYGRDSETSRI